MSVQAVTTNNTISNTIIFAFNTTIDDTTPVTVTLSPSGMGEGSIGGGVVISGLMPDTLYTYTVSFVYNNISYSIQSSVTTLTAPWPTTAFQSSIGMNDIKQGTKFTVANLLSIIYFKLCLAHQVFISYNIIIRKYQVCNHCHYLQHIDTLLEHLQGI